MKMRISSVISFIVFATLFGILYKVILPLVDNKMWLGLIIFILLAVPVELALDKVRARFPSLDKRLDVGLSALVVVCIFLLIFVIGN